MKEFSKIKIGDIFRIDVTFLKGQFFNLSYVLFGTDEEGEPCLVDPTFDNICCYHNENCEVVSINEEAQTISLRGTGYEGEDTDFGAIFELTYEELLVGGFI